MLDVGQRRLLASVLFMRLPRVPASSSDAPADKAERWYAEVHDALAEELIEYGIDDVVINRYGLALEDLMDALSDERRSR